MTITSLQHVNIRTPVLDETVRFFVEVVGLRKGDRPAFKFPGAWLYCGDEAVMHLIGESESSIEPGSGRVDHVAFGAKGWDRFIDKLKAMKIEHETRQVPGNELRQIFVNDPNGVRVELNFRTDE